MAGISAIGKTSRVLSVYHLFLNCAEVSLQEFSLNFGVGQRTAVRDIRLLRQTGVLRVRRNGFLVLLRDDRERVAQFLIRPEDWKTAEERTLLVCPEEPLEPWADVPPENVYLAEQYYLTRALLYRLEGTEGAQWQYAGRFCRL